MPVNTTSKNLHYPKGFQEDVDRLMERLSQNGVDLLNPKHGTLSESRLFRYLVTEKLKELGVTPQSK